MAGILHFEVGTLLMVNFFSKKEISQKKREKKKRVNREEDAAIFFESGAQTLKNFSASVKIPFFEKSFECQLIKQNFHEAKRILAELMELAQSTKIASTSLKLLFFTGNFLA